MGEGVSNSHAIYSGRWVGSSMIFGWDSVSEFAWILRLFRSVPEMLVIKWKIILLVFSPICLSPGVSPNYFILKTWHMQSFGADRKEVRATLP